MKEKLIKVEKTVKYVTKEELAELGYKEICAGSMMMKYYPADKSWIGDAIFKKVAEPGIKDAYWDDSGFMSLHTYKFDEDPEKFIKKVKKAIDKYRSDMMKLGLLEEKKCSTR